ncbi:5-formyltetrahydrofolate cyclo-ligase [Peterkaempfera griseoplana]|uniref:5-formyltetrahydrofolate cyclo-ligase n=1 Tax=Peterkaempfera griseoplana TaxID=66896 RepID=UPI0006E247D7|nr:5-formyltetrahydrofolate cyclo-ligase [Peterkaempfera griseoplana]
MDNEKTALRSRLLARRRALPPEERRTAARLLAGRALELLEGGAPATVAAYVSVGSEPGTRVLLEALRSRGVRVLLPVLLPDNDLDWAVYDGPGSLAPAGRGLLEPTGPRLGPEAVCGAALVLLPGLAVDGRGLRLGRGGGSYDRVLARLAAAGSAARLVTLLYDGELLESVPAEPHDRAVSAAVTPSGVRTFG